MTAAHPALVIGHDAGHLFGIADADMSRWLEEQHAADLDAVRCRRECEVLGLHSELVAALVSACASSHMIAAASKRFADWNVSAARLWQWFGMWPDRLPDPPCEADAAATIVATCIELECVGMLERPVKEVRGGLER